MRPYMGALKNFESPDLQTATFPDICNGFLTFVPIDTKNVRTKLEVRIALPVPEIG